MWLYERQTIDGEEVFRVVFDGHHCHTVDCLLRLRKSAALRVSYLNGGGFRSVVEADDLYCWGDELTDQDKEMAQRRTGEL